jgi:pimeloyl-ACP methyl ester carboxylesterase
MPGRDLFARLRPLAILVALTVLVPGSGRAFAAPGPSFATLRSAGASEVKAVFVRPPRTAPAGQPLQVLVALHGMGGNGSDFGNALAEQADAHGWLIVAPTIAYGDWTRPELVAREDPALIAWLADYISHLNDSTGYVVQPRALLFGHSRGAQLALRFTEVYPGNVAGVAAVSAGTYTLPESIDPGTGQLLTFPFGVADLAQTDGGQAFDAETFDAVPIWIGVGGADNNPADVPSAWTPFIGPDRLQRAQAFTRTLHTIGAEVSLKVFPNTDHTLTDAMRSSACDELATDLAN